MKPAALVMMVASPLLGKLLPIVGLKFMLIAGIWFAGWSNILFGVLGDIEDVTTFTILCFVVRSVGAFGAASFSTASYTYIIHLFPDNVGLAFGLTEVTFHCSTMLMANVNESSFRHAWASVCLWARQWAACSMALADTVCPFTSWAPLFC